MDVVSVRELAQSAVDALRDVGASERTVTDYRCRGFGELRRRFEARGVTGYSAELAHAIVLEARAEFECGALSEWRFGWVRRAAALLELFRRTGTVDLARLPKWQNRLRWPNVNFPERDSLHSLVRTALDLQRQQGITPPSLHQYVYSGFVPILLAHQTEGLTQYSRHVSAELLVRSRARVEKGELSATAWSCLRRCVAVLDEVASTGRIVPHARQQRWGLRQPCAEFSDAVDQFCVSAAADFGWAETSIATVRSAVRRFLFAAEDGGVTAVSGFTRRTVSGLVTTAAQRCPGGLGTFLFAVRAFLRHLHAVGATATDLSPAVPRLPAPRRVVREGFTAEEVHALTEGSEHGRAIDKRDRAIMTLAAQTGMRACDLAGLQRSDIDWRTREIRLVQRKTGRALCLPLAVASGNAIADYLLSCRVAGDSPYLFVCAGAEPFGPMNGKAISSVVARRMRRRGLDNRIPRRGAHSFRRGLGTAMLEADVPVDTVTQVLGHRHVDSARPYLSVSEKGLKACAISLADAVGAGELS